MQRSTPASTSSIASGSSTSGFGFWFGVSSIGGEVPAARSIGSTRIRPCGESSRSVA
jgi:hypothetical protein